MPLMPMLGITNIPEAKAHKNKKVKKQIKKCFGIKPTKVTADMYFNKEKYKGKPCKKVRKIITQDIKAILSCYNNL